MEILDIEHTTLFQGKVTVWQPVKGYRFALDSIMLAAFVPATTGQYVLELGIGVGAAALALAFQHADIYIHGIEFQKDILPMTKKNIHLNGWDDRFELIEGNLRDKLVSGNFYDHVMMNPPFFTNDHYTDSPYIQKTFSHSESTEPLKEWINEASRALKQRGYITIIHQACRLDDILNELYHKFGGIEVFPLWPKKGRAAKRILVRGRKGVKTPLILHPGIIVHESDGQLTQHADQVINQAFKLSHITDSTG